MSFGAVYCLYDDHEYLDASLSTVAPHVDHVLFLVNGAPWYGPSSDNQATIAKVEGFKGSKFSNVHGAWATEAEQRNFGLWYMFRKGIDVTLTVDTDEIYQERDFLNLLEFVSRTPVVDAFHVEWDTYWKKSYHRIRPRERFRPLVACRTARFMFTSMREGITSVVRTGSSLFKSRGPYNGIVVPPEVAVCHHLSYARDDAQVKRKIETFSHAPEIIPGWYENVWLKWKPGDHDLHPVTPAQYKAVEPTDFRALPDPLKVFVKKERTANRRCTIIILNWNSKELLKRCLRCVRDSTSGHNYEIVIVDNGSTKDDSVAFLKALERLPLNKFCDIKVIYNSENLGFAPAVNQAMRLATGDVCLLNVDAEPEGDWLGEMYGTLVNNPDAGIVGPLGNQVASGMQAAGSTSKDMPMVNLHGFCMLILKEVIDKVGLLDERYPMGTYEDNDFGMRAKMAGFTLWVSAKSLVVHKAHQVCELNGVDFYDQEHKNREIYLEKYHGMLLWLSHRYDFFQDEALARALGLVVKDPNGL